MKKTRVFLFFLFLFSSLHSFAQDKSLSEIDSLLSKSERFLKTKADTSLKYAFMAAELSQRKKSNSYLTKSYIAIGNAFYKSDDIEKEIYYFQKANEAAVNTSDRKLKIQTAIELAEVLFVSKGNYDDAFLIFQKAKAMIKTTNDTDLLYKIYVFQGNIFKSQEKRNLDSSEYYFNKALNIAITKKNTIEIADTYTNFSEIYYHKNQMDTSMSFLNKAIALYEKSNDIEKLAMTYKNIGNIYWKTNDNKKSIEYYTKAYNIYKTTKSTSGTSVAACDLAYMYAMDNRKDLFDKYADESYSLAQKSQVWRIIQYSSAWLSEAYEKIGNDKKALFYHKALSSINDSINNRSRIEKSAREQLQGGFEEKIRNIKLEEEKQKAIQEEKVHNQQVVRNILIAGFIISIILLFITLRSYNEKKKANLIITQQKQEVEKQKIKIEEKNKEITDSINYAKFIQQSILPDTKEIMQIFPNSFGLYKPKAVVSGDFYWFHYSPFKELENYRIGELNQQLTKSTNQQLAFIAAADCTGHGVPGALMSMIGIDKLNHATANNITDPGEILSFINAEIKNTLKQNEGTQISQDGMDIALLKFESLKVGKSESSTLQPSNFTTLKLSYAGANRPLWIIRDGKLIEYKPTKAAIGGYTSTEQKFMTNEISIQKNDSIYIFSDGYADQFGGGKGKKMMTKNFKELLLSIQNMPILEQEKYLDEKFKSWQGDFEQVDDILVIGIRM